MSVVIQCPGCLAPLTIADENLGRRMRCPECKTGFIPPPPDEPAPTPPPAAPPPARSEPQRPAPQRPEPQRPEPRRSEEAASNPFDFQGGPSRREPVREEADRPRRQADEDEDDRPRRRKRDEEEVAEPPRKRSRQDDEDDRPRRKQREEAGEEGEEESLDSAKERWRSRGRFLALLALFSCLLCWFQPIGIILGVVAYLMARSMQKEMRRRGIGLGLQQRPRQAKTRAILGVSLGIILLLGSCVLGILTFFGYSSFLFRL